MTFHVTQVFRISRLTLSILGIAWVMLNVPAFLKAEDEAVSPTESESDATESQQERDSSTEPAPVETPLMDGSRNEEFEGVFLTPSDVTVYQAAPAPPLPPAPPPFDGPFFGRPKLTGDWFGARGALREDGVTLDIINTQYFQGVVSGGREEGFNFGGRNDYLLNLQGEKLGLWAGSFLDLHGETRYGESSNRLIGALMPANLALVFPKPNGMVTSLTGVKFTQALSQNLLVFAGKINAFDNFKQPLTGAGLLDGFQNTGLMLNPVYVRTVPYSTLGAGLVVLESMQPVLSLAIFDTNDNPTSSGFDSFFDNGATIYAQVNRPTSFFDRPGHHGISGTYSSGTYRGTDPSFFFDPILGLGIQTSRQSGSWCLTYNFDQAIYVNRDNPQRVWGVFGNLGIADKNPSPVRWYASAGISGTSPLAHRTSDSFGVGYFYLGVSDNLKSLNPILGLPLRDEHGVELYYNVAVNPWCQITPDIQVITPTREGVSTSLLFGVRAKIDF